MESTVTANAMSLSLLARNVYGVCFTMRDSRELLRGELSNYKLNTIADYYGFVLNHHRAFDDALTTAKIFIELVKKRKKLP